MCQMSVVLEKDNQQNKIMDSIAKLEVDADGITLSALFEDPLHLSDTSIKEIDFTEGVVTLIAK